MAGAILKKLFSRQSNDTPSSPTALPNAYVFVPDQVWDGNDGSWSTFIIQVGTPPQYFRVLPSINGRETWIPMPLNCDRGKSWCGNARGVEPFRNPSTAVELSTLDAGQTCSANKSPMCDTCLSIEGHCTTGACAGQYCCGGTAGSCNSAGCNGVSGICTSAYIGCNCIGDDYDAFSNNLKSPGAANPSTAIGFQHNQSSTWEMVGNKTLESRSNATIIRRGLYGMDVIAIGPNPEASLTTGKTSAVAGIAAKPFYLGLLGLRPADNSRFNKSSPSFLSLMKDSNKIPGMSFGYAAGAGYRLQGILGSLVLGGYDRSRQSDTNVTFELSDKDSYALNAGVQSVTATNTLVGDVELLSNSITATVDSDLPYLQLPISVCENFERALGLFWDPTMQLYLVNDTIHGRLREDNPTFSFSLGRSPSQAVNITLPYQAFDLQVTQPIAENGTNYFPLKCTSNSSQYILGRSFLQETYLFVDYDASTFSLSQAQFNNASDIVTVNHAVTSIPPSDPADTSPGRAGLSKGSIAGIAVGASIAAVLLISVLFFLLRRVRRRKQQEHTIPPELSASMSMGDRKESWHHSSTSSQELTSSSDADSPFQSLAERLNRLEQANANTKAPDYNHVAGHGYGVQGELPGNEEKSLAGVNSSGQDQELPGSPTAKELPDSPVIERDRSKDAFELAANGK